MSRRDLNYYLFFVLFFLTITGCSKDEPKPIPENPIPESVAFNEINSTGNPDWIELYNYGDTTVDLTGFIVFDEEANKYTLPSGHKMGPGEFLILNCDDQGTGLNLPFKLTSLGESVTLQRPDGKMIDHVVFPAMENSQTYARFPDGSGTWQVTGFSTQNKTNGSGPVSFFKSYNYTPEIPLVGEDILFTLEISDGNNVSSIEIFYALEGGAFESVGMTSPDKITYAGTVPAISAENDLLYYFKLTDITGNEVYLPEDGLIHPYKMTLTSGDVPNLVINEIMASNLSTIADPDTVGEYDDWIEVYNAGSTAVDMGRFYFSDSENPFDDRIPRDAPDKTTIQPGGYLLFWADGTTSQGPNHLKFKLSASGEIVSLYYKDGRLIDSHTFDVQSPDISEGRSTDGGPNWIKFNTPTPGAANQ